MRSTSVVEAVVGHDRAAAVELQDEGDGAPPSSASVICVSTKSTSTRSSSPLTSMTLT